MPNELLVALSRLSNPDLVARLKSLTASERETTAQLVAHLAELDTRDIHLREGYPSLFVYCRDVLGLSEHEAYNRIDAARAARRFPVILDLLAEGAVHLTTVRLLGPHLTPDNYLGVLQSARGKRKAEVEEIVARLAPRPDVAPAVRKLPKPAPPPRVVPGEEACEEAATVAAPLPLPSSPAPPRPAATPLSPDRYRIQFTIGTDTLEKLRRAKDLLRHAIPSGDEAAILDRALTALLAELAKKKFAATERPRPSPGMVVGSRHIPADVKRAVWRRDLGRCAFTGTNGHRCTERAFLEFHHVQPYAVGGEPTVANVQLRCQRHNAYEARAYFEPLRAYTAMGSCQEQLVLERVGR